MPGFIFRQLLFTDFTANFICRPAFLLREDCSSELENRDVFYSLEPGFIDLLKNTNLPTIRITVRVSFSSRAQSYRRLNIIDIKLMEFRLI